MATHSLAAVLAILGMATVTYLTRAGGLFLMSRTRLSRRVELWLSYIPGAILISIVAPTLAQGGMPELVAAFATVGIAMATRMLPLAMGVGVLLVFLLR